jgi:hypothetical protein
MPRETRARARRSSAPVGNGAPTRRCLISSTRGVGSIMFTSAFRGTQCSLDTAGLRRCSHPVRAGLAGMLGDAPAGLTRQFGEHPAQEPATPGLHPREPGPRPDRGVDLPAPATGHPRGDRHVPDHPNQQDHKVRREYQAAGTATASTSTTAPGTARPATKAKVIAGGAASCGQNSPNAAKPSCRSEPSTQRIVHFTTSVT